MHKIFFKEPVTPQSALALFGADRFVALLDSTLLGVTGRYSYLGADPFLVMRARGRRVEECRGGTWTEHEEDPVSAVRRVVDENRMDPNAVVPFCSGGIGYFGYDLKDRIERLPDAAVREPDFPDLYWMFFKAVLCFDHAAGEAFVCGEKTAARNLFRRITEGAPASVGSPVKPDFKLNYRVSKRDYLSAIERAKEHIRRGDIYEVNLSHRCDLAFSHAAETFAGDLYGRLAKASPSPFSAFLRFDDLFVVSSSPERFLSVEGRAVESRPIKGTRPRGENPQEDRELMRQLRDSEKDRAENLMIVDLTRNDLGRICETGSIEVPSLFDVETYRTVFQMVSVVKGVLLPDVELDAIVRACFPPGSMTGTPKISAMKIIETLEPFKRGIYSGALGWIGFDGNLDLSVVIRTLILQGRSGWFQVGGAIVADSDPEAEYRETLDKAAGILDALGPQPKP